MNYWLLKSEPDTFSIDDLAKAKRRTTHWDGVRNYQARNMMRDEMRRGDRAFFYHSSCKEPAVVGLVRIARGGYPDHTAFDPRDPHFDPKSDPENPRWYMVDVAYVRKLKRAITLEALREHADSELRNMPLLRRGNRLSVMPITKSEWDFVLALE